MNNATRTNETNKISNFVQAAIYLVFILAIVAIVVGVSAFVENQDTDIAIFLLAIGFISMALAGYILLQSRKRTADLKIDAPPIITTIECKKCGIIFNRNRKNIELFLSYKRASKDIFFMAALFA